MRKIPELLLQTEDAATSIRPRVLKVSNDTLVDNGDGTASITTGGGGGGGSFSGASVYRTGAALSVSSGTDTFVSYTTENYDVGDLWNISDPTRLTAPSTGYYRISGVVEWSGNTTGYRMGNLYVNGVYKLVLFAEQPSVSGGFSVTSFSVALSLTAADYVELSLWQNSGSTLTMISGATENVFEMESVSASGSSGTVTSVALTVPAELSVSGSPVTTTGTLAVTKATQNANKVWAGPTNGADAQPAFRALVAADIPAIAESGVTSLTTDLTAKTVKATLTAKGSIYAASAASTPAELVVGSDGQVLTADSGETTGVKWATPASGSGYSGYINIQDQKTQNTAGGTFTSGAWQTRVLNTEVADTGSHAAIASNQITLLAGTYQFEISVPARGVDRHQARLQNITDTTTAQMGQSGYSPASGDGDTMTLSISGRMTIAGTKVFEVQHRCATTANTNGFGVEANLGTEIYTVARFWRE